ncbi:MAG TPA: dihydroorotase [Candidatus Bathyarchaeia archaeon]|nr:dihydroorotase [Candidatus Bathyarchaeia archaeon]
MLHELVIEGHVVNPEGIHEAQIGIDEGNITELKKQGLKGEQEIETRRCLIFPGVIDLHAHLREDSSHKWDYKEDFKSGTAAALHGGITTVVDMPNTPLPGINAERIREKKELARTKSKGLIDILFYGGVTESNLNALADMQKEVVAYKLYLSETGGLHIGEATLPKALKVIEATSKPAVIHCEDQHIIDSRREEFKSRGEGEKKHKELHSELRPDEAELSAVKNVLSSASASSGIKINIAHVSVYDTVGILRQYKNVHCEVTPHHLFFTKNDVVAKKSFLKTNPPLRTEENRQRLLAAFKEGQIDFLATDHAPHTKEEKAQNILDAPAGVPNLDTYGNFVSWLIVRCDVHPTLIARVCAYNPALFLGLNDRGRIDVGKRANLTILDLQKQVKIRSEHLYTKCGWSPFDGYEFPGTVRHTIFNGIVATEYDEVLSDLFRTENI